MAFEWALYEKKDGEPVYEKVGVYSIEGVAQSEYRERSEPTDPDSNLRMFPVPYSKICPEELDAHKPLREQLPTNTIRRQAKRFIQKLR